MSDIDLWHAWRRRFRTLPPNVQRLVEWLLIFLVTIALVLVTREWLRFLLIPVTLILFLRVADRVPLIGPLWRWLFGDRSLWDWLTLLFIRLALAVIGLQVSSLFNAQRSDSDVEKTRFEAVERYLTTLASTEILPLTNPPEGKQEIQESSANDNDALKHGCGFAQPRAVTATSLTRALASSLTHLRKSIDDKQIQKKIILDYIYTRGLINRGSNVIDLRHADMTSGNFYQADLKNSCLNDIMFADSATSPSSASDFRFADLQQANLSGANLARANLRNANLQGAVLTNWASLYRADLRGADLRGIEYDKNTTNFDGAIYNSKLIEVDHDRKGWLGFILCGQRQRIFDVSRLCHDPRDYKNIRPTRFPDKFYTVMPDKNGENGILSKKMMAELVYKVNLVELNDLP
jgi:uncharacterized protein YjbI with pentapeptide repeats